MTAHADLTRDYHRHRDAILAMLRAEFGELLDEHEREDLCQTAWLALVEEQRRGGDLRNVGGFLRTVAWRRARDRVRNASPALVDPLEGVLELAPDEGRSPEEEAAARVDAARCRQLVETLSDDERAIVTLRFGWDVKPQEIQRLLGMRRPRYNKLVARAMERLAERAEAMATGEWSERQRALLLACEAGTASPEERERAQRLVREDPACRAILAEIRGWSRSAAALTPLALVVDRAHASPLALLARLLEAVRGAAARASDGLAGAAGPAAATPAAVVAIAITGLTLAGPVPSRAPAGPPGGAEVGGPVARDVHAHPVRAARPGSERAVRERSAARRERARRPARRPARRSPASRAPREKTARPLSEPPVRALPSAPRAQPLPSPARPSAPATPRSPAPRPAPREFSFER